MTPIILGALVAAAAVVAYGIFDTMSFSSERWHLAGRSRGKWIALFFGFGPLAVLLYWGTVRYELRFPERYLPD